MAGDRGERKRKGFSDREEQWHSHHKSKGDVFIWKDEEYHWEESKGPGKKLEKNKALLKH